MTSTCTCVCTLNTDMGLHQLAHKMNTNKLITSKPLHTHQRRRSTVQRPQVRPLRVIWIWRRRLPQLTPEMEAAHARNLKLRFERLAAKRKKRAAEKKKAAEEKKEA